MRSRQLETALAEFVEEAAQSLQADLDAGAEVSFELTARSSRGRETPLYCYRPLTDAFIGERWVQLRGLDSHARAAQSLEGFEGLDRHLLAHDLRAGRAGRAGRDSRRDDGAGRWAGGWAGGSTDSDSPGRRGSGRVDVALRALLEEVFAEQSDFEVRDERLRGVLERLEGSALTSAAEVTLLATLHGLTIASPELQLAPGLGIARSEALGGLPDGALEPRAPDGAEGAGHLLAAFTTEDTDAFGAVARGREALGGLLRALRLFGDGRVALGRLAWARAGTGAWVPLALPWGGRPHGMLVVTPEQEDELRAFCNLVARRAPRDDDELAWALARFEMGCERTTELEALSDYLLALRALLEPEGPSRGLLAGRLAALCAVPSERAAMTERVAQTIALERAVVEGAIGGAVEGGAARGGATKPGAGANAPIRELAENLRALLRDVVCGHLAPNLATLADELLGPGEDGGDGERPGDVASPGDGAWPGDGEQARDDDPWETDQLKLAGLPGLAGLMD
jgi:hypothetical protein